MAEDAFDLKDVCTYTSGLFLRILYAHAMQRVETRLDCPHKSTIHIPNPALHAVDWFWGLRLHLPCCGEAATDLEEENVRSWSHLLVWESFPC